MRRHQYRCNARVRGVRLTGRQLRKPLPIPQPNSRTRIPADMPARRRKLSVRGLSTEAWSANRRLSWSVCPNTYLVSVVAMIPCSAHYRQREACFIRIFRCHNRFNAYMQQDGKRAIRKSTGESRITLIDLSNIPSSSVMNAVTKA